MDTLSFSLIDKKPVPRLPTGQRGFLSEIQSSPSILSTKGRDSVEIKAEKWGGYHYIPLPKKWLNSLGVRSGDLLAIRAQRGTLYIRAAKDSAAPEPGEYFKPILHGNLLLLPEELREIIGHKALLHYKAAIKADNTLALLPVTPHCFLCGEPSFLWKITLLPPGCRSAFYICDKCRMSLIYSTRIQTTE